MLKKVWLCNASKSTSQHRTVISLFKMLVIQTGLVSLLEIHIQVKGRHHSWDRNKALCTLPKVGGPLYTCGDSFRQSQLLCVAKTISRLSTGSWIVSGKHWVKELRYSGGKTQEWRNDECRKIKLNNLGRHKGQNTTAEKGGKTFKSVATRRKNE